MEEPCCCGDKRHRYRRISLGLAETRYQQRSISSSGCACDHQRRAADAIEPTAAKQTAPAIGEKTSSVAKVDSKRVDELAAALNSGGVDEQIEAINLFAKVGTAEQKAAIVAKAGNRDAKWQCALLPLRTSIGASTWI